MGQPTVIKSSLPSPDDTITKRLGNDLQNHISKKSKLLPGATETPTVSSGVSSNTYASRLEDPDELFGRHVANELRLIKNIKAKQFAKLQIHNILFNAQFGLATIPQDIGIPTTVSDSLKKCIDKIAQNERLWMKRKKSHITSRYFLSQMCPGNFSYNYCFIFVFMT